MAIDGDFHMAKDMLCIDHGTDLMVAARDERRFERGPSLGVQVRAVAQMRAPKWTFDPT